VTPATTTLLVASTWKVVSKPSSAAAAITSANAANRVPQNPITFAVADNIAAVEGLHRHADSRGLTCPPLPAPSCWRTGC
jgi:hypothetical protein